MNKKTNTFIKELKSLTLDTEVKMDLRAQLNEYADYKPVRESHKASSLSLFSFFITRPAFASVCGVVLLVALTGTGVTQAAKISLPGDVLYLVKINFNEPFREFLTFTPRQTAKVALSRAEERLQEISILQERGVLDENTKVTLVQSYEKHTSEAKRIADKIRIDDEKAADTIIAMLNYQEGVRTKLLENNKSTLLTTHILEGPAVEERLAEVANENVSVATTTNQTITTAPQANKQTNTVRQMSIQEQIERVRKVVAEVEEQLRTVDNSQGVAKTSLATSESLDMTANTDGRNDKDEGTSGDTQNITEEDVSSEQEDSSSPNEDESGDATPSGTSTTTATSTDSGSEDVNTGSSTPTTTTRTINRL